MDAAGPLVIDLREIDAGMVATAGGKAANLGEMLRAGLPVPAGVCVTTAAYDLVAGGAELGGLLDALATTAPDDLDTLTALAGRVRAALLAAPVPPSVAAAVSDGYASLGADVPVAVRSSATAEDLPSASFAGQLDTRLDVTGDAAVQEAVAGCWASLWTDRAVVYRAAAGVDPRTVRLAVIIQRMVPARVTGVLFTANPVTGRRGESVVDANPGLGDAVVSGAITPDNFVLTTATGEIVGRRLAGAVPSLDDDQVRAVAALGARVAAHFGAPQDIEWALDQAGALRLTQARPITTLYPLPPERDGLHVYFCLSVMQGLQRPITPMGLAAFRLLGAWLAARGGTPLADPRGGPALLVEIGQRPFLDVTGLLRDRTGRRALARGLELVETRSAAALRGLPPQPLAARHSRWPFLRAALRIAVRSRLPAVAARALVRPAGVYRRLDGLQEAVRARLSAPPGATPVERLDLVERALTEQVLDVVPRILPISAAGLGMLALAGRLLGLPAVGEEMQVVLRGLPHDVTTEMDLALWRLAGRVRADAGATRLLLDTPVDELVARWRSGTLPPAVGESLTAFLDRYGHRAVAEIDLGLPRWSEDPRHVLGVLVNYLRLTDPEVAPDVVFARSAHQAEAAVAALVRRARWPYRPIVRFSLRRARQLAGLRELPKYAIVVALAALRAHLMEVGAALAEQAISRPPRTCSSSTSCRCGPGSPAPTCTPWSPPAGRSTRRSCAAGGYPGSWSPTVRSRKRRSSRPTREAAGWPVLPSRPASSPAAHG